MSNPEPKQSHHTEGNAPERINWKADSWFAKYHEPSLSDDFKTWWVSFYGPPDDYSDSETEQHEYWVRCAFSLSGWNAHKESI